MNSPDLSIVGHLGGHSLLQQNPWGWWRSQMPVVDRWAYLDHAAVAPLSRPAVEAIVRFSTEASEQGDTLWPDWAAELEGLRGDFAELLSAAHEEIALVPNTSYGINLVAEGFRWRQGDNIVIPANEFPSNVLPWRNQSRKGVELRVVPTHPDGRIDRSGILDAIDTRTQIVAASWVGFASGRRLDLESFVADVHRAGALFFLDAIQGLGVFPVDFRNSGIDFLAADGHKWLLGPEGAGVVAIRRERLESLDCTPVGWNSVRGAYRFDQSEIDLKPDASRFEIGSSNLMGFCALRGSLSMFLEILRNHGRGSIASRVLNLAAELGEELRAAGATTLPKVAPVERSGIVPFGVPGVSPSQFRQSAADHSVAVSCRGIGIRASIHAYNDRSDIERLIEVVRRATNR